MGTWGAGLLDSDSAQDFLDQVNGIPVEARSTKVEQVLVRVAEDPSAVNREFVPEEVVAAVAVVAVTAARSREFEWMNNETLIQVAGEMGPQDHLRDAAISALSAVAGSDDSPLLSGWKNEDDRRLMERQIDEIRSVLRDS
ncbi:DUF4259 domain-containing protein [Streptomyces sp. NPDC002763]|uniref:DUF4259 domain-containing protein n=1 Tax=Streptomyces sp. NPDC002763 TaxID=3154427 RepID=UPI003329A1B3